MTYPTGGVCCRERPINLGVVFVLGRESARTEGGAPCALRARAVSPSRTGEGGTHEGSGLDPALSRQGMEVREVKMRDSMFIEESVGELILSRQVQRLSAQHNARSILMGTYAQGQDYVYVSARVVRAGDAMVLGSADFRLPLNNNPRSLLEGQGGW